MGKIAEHEYQDFPEWGNLSDVNPILDFLPSPAELAGREVESEKITIFLDKPTVDFFRGQAATLGASYQRMIRELLRDYAELHQNQT